MTDLFSWASVCSVFLDMDGTLLDLHYDNYFWLQHVPRRYAEHHGLDEERARRTLMARYRRVQGSLQWYCVDYWTRELGLDIRALKQEVAGKIAVHPHVEPFLEALRASGRRVVLLTNAHRASVELKLARTGLGRYFHRLVVSHDLGAPKESAAFWPLLRRHEPHEPASSLLVDDNLEVLRAARAGGIGQLVAVRRPDTRGPERDTRPFPAIADFRDLMPVPALVEASRGRCVHAR